MCNEIFRIYIILQSKEVISEICSRNNNGIIFNFLHKPSCDHSAGKVPAAVEK